ncbi:MAG TPA: DUF1295 domain-containing protein [Chitinophagales bacterium]|nr:DUF1295 domain-containing protein [Chitinophagales bacterium]
MQVSIFVWIWIAIAVLIFPIQLFITAPYGRHTKKSWGPMISNKVGWFMMEAWAPVWFVIVYLLHPSYQFYNLLFASLYLLHYINRGFIYPFRTNTKGKQMPLVIAMSAMLFNSVNAGTIAYYLSRVSVYPDNYWQSWHFIAGVFLFILGFVINLKADDMLIHLRKPDETGYKIPRGFLFEYISCPNHFGEIIEWLGYFLMSWNLASLSFFIWTFSNLFPRALKHHQWYKAHFEDYPSERKAVLPGVV